MSDQSHVAIARALAAPALGRHPVPVSRTVTELVILYETYAAIDLTILSFINQPRCEGQALKELNKASLDVDRRRAEVLDEIRASKPRDETEALRRAEVLTRHWFESGSGGDDLPELKDIVTSLEGFL